MDIKFKIVWIFIPILALVIYIDYVKAAAGDKLYFKVNLTPEIALKKKLDTMTLEMEKTAKLYKTAGQKIYWQNEAKKSFTKLLHAYGYYAHNIDIEIDEDKDLVILNVETGPRYLISNLSITFSGESNTNINIPTIDKLKTKKNHFIFAEDVLEDQDKIIKFIEKNNCLLYLSVAHQLTVNHLNKEIEIVFLIDDGPIAKIEKVEFKGLTNVKSEYARKLVKLSDGQCFKRSYVTEARSYLQKSSLFSSTTPEIPKTLNPDGSVPIVFNLTERKARSMKAGLNYGTDFGPGAALGWEHRNFFGSGEEAKISLSGNKKEQIFSLDYEKPFFRRDDQTLRLENNYENKKTKAFKSKEASLAAYLDRELTPEWKIGGGTKFTYAVVNQFEFNKNIQKYSLFSLPVYVGKDTRNNILDAKKGYNIILDAAPFFGIDSKNKPFLKSKLSAAGFVTNKGKIKSTLALKGSVGSIFGGGSFKVPSTEKFYVGGSNSVRGYAYQFVGNIDKNKRPKGGTSFVETTIELRLNITDDISIVNFLDSGFAYEKNMPDKKQALLHGAGIGFRYATGFGPLRADIGFPLKKRKHIDKGFQLYFGIGQAF